MKQLTQRKKKREPREALYVEIPAALKRLVEKEAERNRRKLVAEVELLLQEGLHSRGRGESHQEGAE